MPYLKKKSKVFPIPFQKMATFSPLIENTFFLWVSAFGLYLLYYTIHVWPYAVEIFSDEGVLPNFQKNWTFGYFPNYLYVWDSSLAIHFTFAFRFICAILIIFRIRLFECGLLSWYFWACLYNRNNMIEDPSVPYVGWMCIALALFSKKSLCPYISLTGWGLMILGSFYNAISKFSSPSWIDGQAIALIFQLPIAYSHSKFLLPFASVLTYLAIASQLVGPILCLFYKTRFWGWAIITSMHIFILVTLDITQVSLAMLLFQLFFWRPTWKKYFRLSF